MSIFTLILFILSQSTSFAQMTNIPVDVDQVTVQIEPATSSFNPFSSGDENSIPETWAVISDNKTGKKFRMAIPLGMGPEVVTSYVNNKKKFYIDQFESAKALDDEETWKEFRTTLLSSNEFSNEEKKILSQESMERGLDELLYDDNIPFEKRKSLEQKIKNIFLKNATELTLVKQPIGAYLNFVYQHKPSQPKQECSCIELDGVKINSCEQ